MEWQRRSFLGLVPLSALSLQLGDRIVSANESSPGLDSVISSPPVVQHPQADGFSVHFAVSSLATGWVEWGWSPERLDRKAFSAHNGLICASDVVLSVRVRLDEVAGNRPVYYRVVAQSLAYTSAYQLRRGKVVATDVKRLRLPSAEADQITIAVVNDTHENVATLKALHTRIASADPDVLIWNGDTCNDFDAKDDPMQIVLNPARDIGQGWAAERPLLFVPGNHDVRGQRARELSAGLGGWPGQADLPYNFALRLGPIALVGLDTGEDKPDAHPVFAGTAAYEPYREQQAAWLAKVVTRPEIAQAPIRIAACHIPLRGLAGQNDGTTLEGYAAYSGMGGKLWLPILRRAGFSAVISGHMHQHRIDDASDAESVTQVVGGGPAPESATVTFIHADQKTAEIRVENLDGKVLGRRTWSLAAPVPKANTKP